MVHGRLGGLALWCAVLGAGCGYSLGRAPVVGARLGEVTAPMAEPGLAEALTASLAAELARRTAADGPALGARIVEASVRPAAIGGAAQEAQLTVLFRLEDAELSLSARRAFALVEGDPEATAAARAATFGALSAELCAEAVPRLLSAPGAGG
jgi:hypothetical protein